MYWDAWAWAGLDVPSGETVVVGMLLVGGIDCCCGDALARLAPHFQQTDNVAGLLAPHLGQMGLLDNPRWINGKPQGLISLLFSRRVLPENLYADQT